MQGCHSKTKDSDELLFLCFFFNESSNERVLDCDWLEYDETIAVEVMKIKIKNKKKERMMDRRRHHICRVFFFGHSAARDGRPLPSCSFA